jgi:hypothetical protein
MAESRGAATSNAGPNSRADMRLAPQMLPSKLTANTGQPACSKAKTTSEFIYAMIPMGG